MLNLMKVYQGRIVAKGGAEGVHCFGDRNTGIGVAVKIGEIKPAIQLNISKNRSGAGIKEEPLVHKE